MAATFLDYQSISSRPSNSSHEHGQATYQAQSQPQSKSQSTALPTPPPSPPTSRRRLKKKEKDPFLDLTFRTSAPASPSSSSSTPQDASESAPGEHDASQWRITKILQILQTPFLITSFLLSLALISLSDRARRARTYPFPWLDPEPYSYPSSDSDTSPADQPHQQPSSGRWKRRDSAHVGPAEALNRGGVLEGEGEKKHKHKKRWYLHRKIRQMARLEVTEAFELRKWIIAAMLVTGGLGVVGTGWGVWWMWVWVRGWW